MASSKVARRRQGSLPKEPPASVDISDSDGEKDNGLDDFEIIKTIGESSLCFVVQSGCILCYMRLICGLVVTHILLLLPFLPC